MDDGPVGAAWARVEAGLGRVLPESLREFNGPASEAAIDALEAGLGMTLAADFRASLRIRDGTVAGSHIPSPGPSPVPMECLYDTERILEWTRHWRQHLDREAAWHNPHAWAYLVDRGGLRLNGPVRPIIGAAGMVVVGDMNGDVQWVLDHDPAPGGTPGQVVRIDIECGLWDVLAPSWTQLLVRYADDLQLYAEDPGRSGITIEEGLGPACEWGGRRPSDPDGERPAWLRGVEARDPRGFTA